MLYLIQNSNSIKIGFTLDEYTLIYRMQSYKATCPTAMLIGVCDGSRRKEDEYHKIMQKIFNTEFCEYDIDVISDFCKENTFKKINLHVGDIDNIAKKLEINSFPKVKSRNSTIAIDKATSRMLDDFCSKNKIQKKQFIQMSLKYFNQTGANIRDTKVQPHILEDVRFKLKELNKILDL